MFGQSAATLAGDRGVGAQAARAIAPREARQQGGYRLRYQPEREPPIWSA